MFRSTMNTERQPRTSAAVWRIRVYIELSVETCFHPVTGIVVRNEYDSLTKADKLLFCLHKFFSSMSTVDGHIGLLKFT
jgi:hypothetical protein